MANGFNRVASTSERLRAAMKFSNKKQIDLVRETGIDKGSISHYVSGKYEPKQDAIYRLALALNVSEMWLWGYDAPMKRLSTSKNADNISEQKEKPAPEIGNGLSEKDMRILAKIMALPDDKFEDVMDYMDYLISKQDK